MPTLATRSAVFWSLAPREREIRALMPTPVPPATAIIRVWRGKARETADRAFSLIWATKMLSTMLYRAWTSIEIIMGTDILKSSLPTGMTPILFSVGGVLSGLFSIVLLSFSFARVNVCELKLSES